jgi:hypothetical protein
MVFGNVFSVFRKPLRGAVPRWNIPFAASVGENMFGSGNLGTKKFLIDLYKVQPELNAVINNVCFDIAGKFHFTPIKKGDSGRNKILEVDKWVQNNQFNQVLLNQCIDWQMTGEGYSWLGKPTDDQIKEILDNCMKRKFGIKSVEAKEYGDRAFLELKQNDMIFNDEDFMKPRTVRYVASSTMDIKFTKDDIEYYIQRVGSDDRRFELKEIIRLTDLMIDGKPFGFTPVSSMITQLELLKLMWLNQRSVQRNGGNPGKIFAFKNMQPNSPAYRRTEEQLSNYKQVQNKHGNMLITGDLTVTDINENDAMQFKDVGLYVLSVIAMQWRLPKSMLPVVLGGSNTKGDIGTPSAEKSYWTNIERKQDRLAQIYNQQLFIPVFGVKMCFNKDYKQDEVAENTNRQLLLNNIEMENRLLSNYDSELTRQNIMTRLQLKPDDIKKSEGDPVQTGMNRQNMLEQDKVTDDTDQMAKRNQKVDEQAIVMKNRGKPSGV